MRNLARWGHLSDTSASARAQALAVSRTVGRGALTLLLTCAALLALSAPAEAGPWVKAPGSTYVKLGTSRFQGQGALPNTTTAGLDYESFTHTLYTEVGIPGGMQVIASLPFVQGTNVSTQGVRYNNPSLGDGRFELDYGVLTDGIPITIGVETKVPLYDRVIDSASDARFESYPQSRLSFPDPGDGNIDITPKIIAGYSFYPVPAWATAELGYQVRLDGFADGLYGTLSGGIFAVPDLIALGVYTKLIKNVESSNKLSQEFLYTQGFVLVKMDALLPGVGLQIGSGFFPWAEQTAAGYDVSAGVSYEF